MLNVLHFIFHSFWTWLGTLILLLPLSRISIIRVTHSQRTNSPNDDHSVNDDHSTNEVE